MRAATPAAVTLAALLWAVPAGTPADAPKIDAPGVPAVETLNPDAHLRLAVQNLVTAYQRHPEEGVIDYAAYDVTYIRFFSFYATLDDRLEDDTLFFKFWVNMLSLEGAVRLPQEVPGSGGRLFWVDLRWYGWNWAAFRAVAERDATFQEPWVGNEHAELARRVIGVFASEAALKKGVYAAQVIVRGDWFVRETMESNRSASYYDLLFARFRFKYVRSSGGKTQPRLWPGGRDRDGESYRPGYEWREQPYDVVFRNFPKNVDEWDEAFGTDKAVEFSKDRKLDTDFGSILEGNEDNPKKGSIVALHNRIVQIRQGLIGFTMRTFDVFETTGLRDYSETLIFKGKSGFVKGDGVEAVFDAGELINYLPNGGIAGFLIDGKGNRAEIAATQAANLNNEPRLAPGVRNVWDCFKCHAGTGGFISPANVVREQRDKGVLTRFTNADKENRFNQFFYDWEDRLEGQVKQFAKVLTRCTATAKNPKGWTPAVLVKKLVAFREWYDDPVDARTAAREIGVPTEAIRRVVRLRGGVLREVLDAVPEGDEAGAKKLGVRVEIFRMIAKLSPDARPNQLLAGMAIPRRTFDVDVYAKLQLIRSYLEEVGKKDALKDDGKGRSDKPGASSKRVEDAPPGAAPRRPFGPLHDGRGRIDP